MIEQQSLTTAAFDQAVKEARSRVETLMSLVLASMPSVAEDLNQAMRYAALNGGKRVRPLLMYATAQALGCSKSRMDPGAIAVEFIHSYSLVHDDLPAMDDDDLRRGQPTCHIAFDEATAILAGDALQSLAYEVLVSESCQRDVLQVTADELLSAEERVRMVLALTVASGTSGMAAGQALDLAAQGQSISLEELEKIHKNKTGRLIEVCVEIAIIAAGCSDPEVVTALTRYAEAIGLAFQVQDDILDVTGNTVALGKQAGADLLLDKATFPSLLGLEKAKQRSRALHEAAVDALLIFGEEANLLRAISEYTVSRTS